LSSKTTEMLVALTRDGAQTLQSQIEQQIRDAVRQGSLRPATTISSTRDLALQLGVSRPLVMEAYAQLAAEGYLTLRQGAAPRISDLVAPAAASISARPPAAEPVRYNFRPGIPDLSSFPRAEWLKATQAALASMSNADFGYGDRHGSAVLREALADYLGRVRGVIAEPQQVMVTSGFEQARALVLRALQANGARRIAMEHRGYAEWHALKETGVEVIPIGVDEDGLRVDELEASQADAVVLTPAHQFRTGVVLSGERRVRLLQWLRERKAVAVEDDYDAEFRYDRAPVGSLQGLDPDHVIYAGTASKTLAPALRLGWLVVPSRLLEAVQYQQRVADYGCSRIEQHALAHFMTSGDFDRHLRRMRTRYRLRRDALVAAVAAHLPEASIGGIAAGLHATVALPYRLDEPAVSEAARRRGVAFDFISKYRDDPDTAPSTLLLGYADNSEAAIRAGVQALATAIRSIEVEAGAGSV
jgi:GntR family transcriptional regulator / MocR family aminotransferase